MSPRCLTRESCTSDFPTRSPAIPHSEQQSPRDTGAVPWWMAYRPKYLRTLRPDRRKSVSDHPALVRASYPNPLDAETGVDGSWGCVRSIHCVWARAMRLHSGQSQKRAPNSIPTPAHLHRQTETASTTAPIQIPLLRGEPYMSTPAPRTRSLKNLRPAHTGCHSSQHSPAGATQMPVVSPLSSYSPV